LESDVVLLDGRDGVPGLDGRVVAVQLGEDVGELGTKGGDLLVVELFLSVEDQTWG